MARRDSKKTLSENADMSRRYILHVLHCSCESHQAHTPDEFGAPVRDTGNYFIARAVLELDQCNLFLVSKGSGISQNLLDRIKAQSAKPQGLDVNCWHECVMQTPLW